MRLKNILSLFFIAPFLNHIPVAHGMEIRYGPLREPNGTYIDMNHATYEHTTAHEPTSLWTDHLRGCVVTVLHIEQSGKHHTLAMSHFSHDKKTYNYLFFDRLLQQLARQNNVQAITKASCVIIPPGIPHQASLVAVLDPEWHHMICQTVKAHVPHTSIEVVPYLFNVQDSAVECELMSGELKITILNKSQVADKQNQDQLLECHAYKNKSACARLAPLIFAAASLTGYIAWNMQ